MAKKNKTVEFSEQQVLETFRNEQNRLESMKRAFQMEQSMLGEIITAQESLKEIKKAKKGDRIFVFLGAGVFAEATIEDKEKVKQNIGSGVIIDQKIETTIQTLEKARESQEKNLGQIRQEIEKIDNNLQGLTRMIIQAQQLRRLKSQL